MAIPKANQQLGQQREQAQAGPTYAPIENQPALFAAQAIYRSQEQLSRTIGQAADTFAKAHQAEERIKVKEAESEMKALLNQFVGFKMNTIIKMGFAAEVILETAQEQGFDLIILGIVGHGFIKEHLIGSTAYQVSRESKVPVLIIPKNKE